MRETDEVRRDVDKALARLSLYESVLWNIAHGHWNAGREEPITAEQYAYDTLRTFPIGIEGAELP